MLSEHDDRWYRLDVVEFSWHVFVGQCFASANVQGTENPSVQLYGVPPCILNRYDLTNGTWASDNPAGGIPSRLHTAPISAKIILLNMPAALSDVLTQAPIAPSA